MLHARKFLICLCLYQGATFADDAAELATLLASYQTLSGQFEQSLVDDQQHVIQESSGSFVLQKPGYFRWDTKEPFPQLLVANLDKIWLYDPDLEQVTVRSYHNTVDQTPSLLLSGDVEKITARYNVSEKPVVSVKSKKLKHFVLTPKQEQSSFTELSLEFRGDTLATMVLKDSLAQTTTFAFLNVVQNQSVPTAEFTFTPPEGVDLLIDD